jgi:CYTH domain-containing protein
MMHAMDIDPTTAAALGFAKTKYVAIEHERRWLCDAIPRDLVDRTEAISDLYITGTQIRLREARPLDGGRPMLRLTRKADVDAETRLISSIYLPEEELAVLAACLTGVRIRKLRHRLRSTSAVKMSIDEFQGAHEGLLLAEAEFDSAEERAAFTAPPFPVVREVTSDLRYTGGGLVRGATWK